MFISNAVKENLKEFQWMTMAHLIEPVTLIVSQK